MFEVDLVDHCSPDKVRSDPPSYSGICLLPVLGKVFERLLVDRLQDAVGHRLCPWQFGFRVGKSVEDAWAHVKRRVHK